MKVFILLRILGTVALVGVLLTINSFMINNAGKDNVRRVDTAGLIADSAIIDMVSGKNIKYMKSLNI